MRASELLNTLRESGARVRSRQGQICVQGKLKETHRDAIRFHKPALLRLLAMETRRQQVLRRMADGEPRPFYCVTDTESDHEFVILACGKPGLATWEMTIPREKYDPFLLLETIQGNSGGKEAPNEADPREESRAWNSKDAR